MMTLMLGYSLRKRRRPLRRMGPTRMWLDYHIFLGICEPLFIVLHSPFKVQGLVALSFWSMVAVALSGILGRFLYRQIPRSRAGDELSLVEVENLDRELSRQLVESFALSPEAVVELEEAAEAGLDPDRSLPVLAVAATVDAFALRRRLRRFRRQHPAIEPRLRRRFERTVRRKALLRRRLLLWSRLRRKYQRCETCHIEHHGREFEIVWWGEGGESAFDHSETGHRLAGAHRDLACRDCHRSSKIAEPERLSAAGEDLDVTFLGLTASCAACHDDPHRGQFGERGCADCHGRGYGVPRRVSIMAAPALPSPAATARSPAVTATAPVEMRAK